MKKLNFKDKGGLYINLPPFFLLPAVPIKKVKHFSLKEKIIETDKGKAEIEELRDAVFLLKTFCILPAVLFLIYLFILLSFSSIAEILNAFWGFLFGAGAGIITSIDFISQKNSMITAGKVMGLYFLCGIISFSLFSPTISYGFIVSFLLSSSLSFVYFFIENKKINIFLLKKDEKVVPSYILIYLH